MSCFVFPGCLVIEVFRSLQLENIRNWILSAAPAASVALEPTFSPGHWSVVSSSVDRSPLCVWGCGEVGLALVVPPLLLVDLVVHSLRSLGVPPKIRVSSLIKLLRCGTDWPLTILISGRLRTLR